jgi:hypothetical protein
VSIQRLLLQNPSTHEVRGLFLNLVITTGVMVLANILEAALFDLICETKSPIALWASR